MDPAASLLLLFVVLTGAWFGSALIYAVVASRAPELAGPKEAGFARALAASREGPQGGADVGKRRRV